jgi:hypothetical protein
MEYPMKDSEHEREAQKATKAPSDSDAAIQEELRREAGEGKGLIGDEAKNRNLSGSSTWETLPDPTDTEG